MCKSYGDPASWWMGNSLPFRGTYAILFELPSHNLPSKVKGAWGRLWKGLFKKFEGPFFPCTLPRPKSSSTQIKTHVYLLHILFLLLLHGPQSEGNWERAEWPTPKRVRGLCDPAPTSAPSVRNPLWLSCGCRPKWMHIPCYKPWLNKKNLIVVSLKWDSSFLPLGKILLL